ncbi:Class E vacuolar protein-sorting machinery protein [Balamuthia mandrillaris]
MATLPSRPSTRKAKGKSRHSGQEISGPISVTTRHALFGVPLPLLLDKTPGHQIPPFVDKICLFIESALLRVEGIFRQSGYTSEIEACKQWLDSGREQASYWELSPHSVCDLLKLYFRELPDPLLTEDLYPCFMAKAKAAARVQERGAAGGLSAMDLKELVNGLPFANRCLLKCLLSLFKKVQENQDYNLMTVSNLATIFGPNILRAPAESTAKVTTPTEMMQEMALANNVVSTLIVHFEDILQDTELVRSYQAIVEALYDYAARSKDEMSMKKGDLFWLMEKDPSGWWKVEHPSTGMLGYVPGAYVTTKRWTQISQRYDRRKSEPVNVLHMQQQQQQLGGIVPRAISDNASELRSSCNREASSSTSSSIPIPIAAITEAMATTAISPGRASPGRRMTISAYSPRKRPELPSFNDVELEKKVSLQSRDDGAVKKRSVVASPQPLRRNSLHSASYSSLSLSSPSPSSSSSPLYKTTTSTTNRAPITTPSVAPALPPLPQQPKPPQSQQQQRHIRFCCPPPSTPVHKQQMPTTSTTNNTSHPPSHPLAHSASLSSLPASLLHRPQPPLPSSLSSSSSPSAGRRFSLQVSAPGKVNPPLAQAAAAIDGRSSRSAPALPRPPSPGPVPLSQRVRALSASSSYGSLTGSDNALPVRRFLQE